MRDHTRLRAFELADSLVLAVYRATRAFPSEERFGLTSQLRRGAVSVASNIVEGCARRTQRDYSQFLTIAYGAARELEYQLSVASRLNYFDEDSDRAIRAQSEETSKVLGALVRSLRQ